jgi:hypothetical protein
MASSFDAAAPFPTGFLCFYFCGDMIGSLIYGEDKFAFLMIAFSNSCHSKTRWQAFSRISE